MNNQQLLNTRFINQGLIDSRFKNVQEVVSYLGAVQSQDFGGATWALGQRIPGSTDKEVEHAFNEGQILRTHVMRPTWHFVAPSDIRWMLKLTAPRVKKLMDYYNRKLKLDDELFKRSQKILVSALKGEKALTRDELGLVLANEGIKVLGQALGHVMMWAELDGIICSGPRTGKPFGKTQGKQFSYMLVEERVPNAKVLTEDEALVALLKKYFQSHGPAQIQDFCWWSGLTVADAKKGLGMLKSQIKHQVIEGKEFWFFGNISTELSAEMNKTFLLPNYDEYGIAYRDREAFYDSNQLNLSDSRANMPFNHMIVQSGQVVGMWKRTSKRDQVIVETKFFKKPEEKDLNSLKDAAQTYGKFLGLSVSLL